MSRWIGRTVCFVVCSVFLVGAPMLLAQTVDAVGIVVGACFAAVFTFLIMDVLRYAAEFPPR